MKIKSSLLTVLSVFLMFLPSCENKENVPEGAQKFNPVTAPNEFREAYARAIISDLEKNGKASIYYPGEQGRLDFENTNVFVINDEEALFVGYVRSPLGPSMVYNLNSKEWRSEE